MTRSEAKRKLQSLVDRLDRTLGAIVFASIASEKGKVSFVIIDSIEGENKSAAKREIRAWAKKVGVKLAWSPAAK